MANLRELLFQTDRESTDPAASKAAVPSVPARTPQSAASDRGAHPDSQRSDLKTGTLSVTRSTAVGTFSLSGSLLGRADDSLEQPDHGLAARSYQELKSKIHTRLIENLDIKALMNLGGGEPLETAIERTVHLLISDEKIPLAPEERHQVARDVLYETLGLGPLEPLMADPEVNDILVNGSQSVWVDRNGLIQPTEIRFKDDNHLLHVINRIVSRIGRRVDECSPIVDARLPDGSRVNAIIPPLSLEGPILSIRRFRATPFNLEDLIGKGTVNRQMADFLGLAVRARVNILISGGTSAGKTTLLNVLSGHVSNAERIITIEDTAELRLQQRHVVRLESRPSNIEGQGSVSQRELVRNALRMRPDRIVVGEVRGPEALDMLQAMNTGHEGSLTTVHANSPRDALSRLETLVLLAGIELSQRSIREQIGSAFDLVVQIKRLQDGSRRVVSIAEITGVQEGVIMMQDLYEFRQSGIDARGQVVGVHVACGLRPQVEVKFKEASIDLSPALFAAVDGAGEQ